MAERKSPKSRRNLMNPGFTPDVDLSIARAQAEAEAAKSAPADKTKVKRRGKY